ncbi:hypothetical protein [Delftia acidovorans]|uniref:hypothetical protein n=1 Tax=Delftia acidovorans TaxID=80866 RepID=UPI003D0B4FBE
MTTAPTPEEVRALAERLEHCVAKWGKQNALSLEAYSAVKMMRRMQASYQALQTENERLRMELVAEASAAAEQKLRADQLAQQHRMQAQMHAQATQQLAELEASKNARIHELEMQALDLASENSILKRQDSELEARKPLPLSDAEIIAAQEALALSRSRIGLPCTRCGTGKYRADCNAYHDFHRCDACMHVPMWDADGNELGATGPLPGITGESS